MEDRGFTELDLRQMLADALAWREDAGTGRFIFECPFRGRRWHVIVEPDAADQVLVVITAFAVGA
jgi:hypothetical protein